MGTLVTRRSRRSFRTYCAGHEPDRRGDDVETRIVVTGGPTAKPAIVRIAM
jgi:hypothetical protein